MKKGVVTPVFYRLLTIFLSFILLRIYILLLILGLKDDAFLFKGNRSSYIEIPNSGKLDTKNSITMLANVYPMGNDGPIINYKKDGWGVHLWQFSQTQLFVRFVTREGKMTTQPLGTRVLEVRILSSYHIVM